MSQSAQFSGTLKENIRASRILCIALVTGIFIFAVIAVVVNQMNGPFVKEAEQYKNLILGITAFISSLCILVAKKQYSRGIAAAREQSISLQDKLNEYRATLIKFMALSEGPALFSVVIFLLTGDLFLLAIIAIMLGFMLAKFPVKKRVIGELQLDWQQQQELE